jgi:Uma2 family endonuclease
MSMGQTARPLVSDVRRRYLASDDRVEIHRGELRSAPTPTANHNLVANRLQFRLSRDFSDRGVEGWHFITATDIDLCIDPEEVRAPDLAGYRLDRWEESWGNEVPIPAPPNWLCEVWSPGNSLDDREALLDAYYAAREIEAVWTIDRAATSLKVFVRGAARWRRTLVVEDVDVAFRAPPFPSVELTLRELLR